jgi:hypothetical protein
MKTVRWNPEKAQKLKEIRGIDFNRIAVMIEERELLGVIEVPSRTGQEMFLLDYDDYIVCVPFIESDHEIFLKTAYRNRKLNKTVKGAS